MKLSHPFMVLSISSAVVFLIVVDSAEVWNSGFGMSRGLGYGRMARDFTIVGVVIDGFEIGSKFSRWLVELRGSFA